MAGFLSRLFGGDKAKEQPAAAPSAPKVATPSLEVPIGQGWDDMEVSGEAYHRDGIGKIFLGLGRDEGGVTMQVAHLIPEPNNKYDSNAVGIHILGEQVGHVPQESSKTVARVCRGLGRGSVAIAPARVWARNDDGTWRSRVTLMFSGDSESEKDYGADRRRQEAEYAEWQAEKERKEAEKAARQAEKEARRTAGSVDGEYWPLLKPTISELKRQKRFDEARDLLAECVGAAEREAAVTGDIPNPWPSEQISVVLRRLRDFQAELSYLERYVSACGDKDVPESVQSRLSRSRLAVEKE